MKLSLLAIGKSHESYVKEGVEDFTKRISHYFSVDWMIVPVPRNAASLQEADLKKREGALILQALQSDDFLVALDEKGKSMSSPGLSQFLGQRSMDGTRRIVFVIGGAFGLHETVISRAQLTWSLSQLTFPHQLVRLVLAEQVYRACTILRNEKYHHK
jgi:23S rRNA (pseudouridine1915-N3)-methyltransferase